MVQKIKLKNGKNALGRGWIETLEISLRPYTNLTMKKVNGVSSLKIANIAKKKKEREIITQSKSLLLVYIN